MIGSGTKFMRTPDSGTTWNAVANIKDLGFPEESRDTSEDSYIDATDSYKEFVAGMIDSGEANIVLKWDQTDTEQVALHADFEGDGQPKMYKIVFPDNSNFVFNAVISKRGKEIPKNETITQSFTFKLSGKPTIGTEV